MSYLAKFKGSFGYPDIETAESALKIIDDEESKPDDDFEINILEKRNFKLDTEQATLTIDFSGFIPASSWYGCYRVICKMSAKAQKGKIKCSFEGDADEWIQAGRGWS